MRAKSISNEKQGFYLLKRFDDIAVLKLGKNFLVEAIDQAIKNPLLDVFDQMILKIAGLNKPVIHADCGEVIPLFLNMSLACDYRIIATHTIFQKPYFELDTLPKGGGAFFLCKMLGYSQAKQLLMSDKDINAIEALQIGIVDQVLPYKDLEKSAIHLALGLAGRSTHSLAGIKRLINYSIKDLKNYLSFESQELLKTMGTI